MPWFDSLLIHLVRGNLQQKGTMCYAKGIDYVEEEAIEQVDTEARMKSADSKRTLVTKNMRSFRFQDEDKD